MRSLLFFIFFLSYSTAFAVKTINCNESSCDTDFNPDYKIDKLYYSSIDIGDVNTDDVFINVNDGEEPRSVRISVNNNTIAGRNISVDLTPNSDQANSGDLIILGDILNNVNINLSGYNGINGKNSSKLCYEEYNKQDNGLFGSHLKELFDEARFLEPNLPKTDCVSFDVDRLLSKFSCEGNAVETENANNPSVIVQRLKGKNQCLGLGDVGVCLSKTVKIECNYRILYTNPVGVAGTFDMTELRKEVRVLTLPELEYEEKKNDHTFRKYICDNLSYIEGTEKPYDIIQNGEFYFNIAGWTNNNSVWNSQQESMRLLPDLVQRRNQSFSQQVLSTIPGEKYRVQVVWRKDDNNVNVDSGQVSVYSDINKTNLIHREMVFEPTSIKPVFLTSDQTPYDYGFLRSQSASVNQTFTIKNKDSRTARNCSVVYLDGNTTDFSIQSQTCGVSNLAPDATCTVTVRAQPQTYGLKEAFLKRDCEDEFGNYTSALNEKLSMVAFRDFTQPTVPAGPPNPNTKYIDGLYWMFNTDNNSWMRCQEDYLNDKFCYTSTEKIDIESVEPFSPGKWFYGATPNGMTHTVGLVVPEINEPPLVKKVDILPAFRFDSKLVDFIFSATTPNTTLELRTLVPEHGANFDSIIVTKLSQTAGPTIKPPFDLKCPTAATEGCESGSVGWGYYELESVNSVLTQPGYDDRYYTIPPDSDWRIRYITPGGFCPQYFSLEKASHLASNIGYDENDNLCDDVYIPEDPSSKLIRWQFITFERKPEFGTELVQCSANNCLVNYTIQETEKNLTTFNLGSGTNGTQQGEGVLFVYDFNNISGIANNGVGGSVGLNNLPDRIEQRACAQILDASTEGFDSEWAKNPRVNFHKYQWRPLKIIEEGNYGSTPRNNGKEIHFYKKIDSSVRFLMKNEIF